MRMTAATLVMLAVPLATVLSCARLGDESVDRSADEPKMVRPTVDEGAATGLLTVTFGYAERTGVYAEGARHYLQVSDNSGAVVLRRDEGTEQGPGAGYTDSVRLERGRYTVQTFQRGCEFSEASNCRTTTAPGTNRCIAPVRIQPGVETVVMIRLKLPRPCRVTVTRGD